MSAQKRKTILNNPLSRPAKKEPAPLETSSISQATSMPPKKQKSVPAKKRINTVPVARKKSKRAEEILSDGINPAHEMLGMLNAEMEEAATLGAEEILGRESKVGSEVVLSIKSTTYSSARAVRIVRLWSWLTVPVSLIPLPLIDSAALIGLQIKMIAELCKCYGVPFRKESVSAIISGLLGGTMAATVASGLRSGAIKHIPHVGYLASAVTEPILNFSSTYAIGSIFIQHFEKNGDLNNFNFDQVRGSFASYVEKGKLIFKFKSIKK